jgi:hypothetical protein
MRGHSDACTQSSWIELVQGWCRPGKKEKGTEWQIGFAEEGLPKRRGKKPKREREPALSRVLDRLGASVCAMCKGVGSVRAKCPKRISLYPPGLLT